MFKNAKVILKRQQAKLFLVFFMTGGETKDIEKIEKPKYSYCS